MPESIIEVDHVPVRRVVRSRCFWLNARYHETGDLFEVLADRWKRYRKFQMKVGSDRIAD